MTSYNYIVVILILIAFVNYLLTLSYFFRLLKSFLQSSCYCYKEKPFKLNISQTGMMLYSWSFFWKCENLITYYTLADFIGLKTLKSLNLYFWTSEILSCFTFSTLSAFLLSSIHIDLVLCSNFFSNYKQHHPIRSKLRSSISLNLEGTN